MLAYGITGAIESAVSKNWLKCHRICSFFLTATSHKANRFHVGEKLSSPPSSSGPFIALPWAFFYSLSGPWAVRKSGIALGTPPTFR